MYEEISVKKRIDWKSLLTKLGVLLLVVFIFCAIAFSPKKTYAVSPLYNITKQLLNAGKEYYVYEKLPINIGEYKTINLFSLIDEEYIKGKDYTANNCEFDDSFVKVTKVNNKEFSIYAKVLCDNDEEVIVDTIKTKKDNNINTNKDDNFSFEVVE